MSVEIGPAPLLASAPTYAVGVAINIPIGGVESLVHKVGNLCFFYSPRILKDFLSTREVNNQGIEAERNGSSGWIWTYFRAALLSEHGKVSVAI